MDFLKSRTMSQLSTNPGSPSIDAGEDAAKVGVPQLRRGLSEVIIEMVKRNLNGDITLGRPSLRLLRQSRLEVMSNLSQVSIRHGSLPTSMLCLTCQPKSCKSSPITNKSTPNRPKSTKPLKENCRRVETTAINEGCITSTARCSSRNWEERARRHLSTTFPRPNAPYFLTADTKTAKPYMSTLTRQPRRPRLFPHRDRQCCYYSPSLVAFPYSGVTFLANRCHANKLRHPCQPRHPSQRTASPTRKLRPSLRINTSRMLPRRQSESHNHETKLAARLSQGVAPLAC